MGLSSSPTFWMTMTYECSTCGSRQTVFLEEGCEGPRVTHDSWETPTGRKVVPVPMTVSHSCGGRWSHVDWTNDRLLHPKQEGIPEAPHFRYPSKTEFKRWKERACGRPVGFL